MLIRPGTLGLGSRRVLLLAAILLTQVALIIIVLKGAHYSGNTEGSRQGAQKTLPLALALLTFNVT